MRSAAPLASFVAGELISFLSFQKVLAHVVVPTRSDWASKEGSERFNGSKQLSKWKHEGGPGKSFDPWAS